MEKVKKILIAIIALIGFATTIKLAIIYYDANFNPYALASFCSVNEFIDCDGIAKTADSQFFGIPLAYWGMFLYLFMIFMLFVDKLKNVKLLSFLEVFKNPLSYVSALGLISFIISMTLFGVSIFHIKKLCVLCFFTYILNLIIALVATDWKSGGFIKSFKDSFFDVIDALKIKKYLITFIVLAVAATGFLTYTTSSMVFAPQVKSLRSLRVFADMKVNPYKAKGNVLGDKDAKLVVNLYTDFVCPICYAQNIMIHKAVKDLKNVRIVHHNFPLDTDCNRYLRRPFHRGACIMAKYGIAAENQDKYWDLNSELFEKQPKSEEEILKIAQSVGLNTELLKKDANSTETKAKLDKEIDDSAYLGIDGTPTMIINGKTYQGIKPYYELKELFINAGAEKR